MPLTDKAISCAKPREKPSKLSDGKGLYLLITPSRQGRANGASKLWRFRYRFGGKEKLLALGTYPEITLADARQRRDEARSQVAHGIDPCAVRKAQKQSETSETETFEVITREWHTKFTPTWTPGYAEKLLSALDRDVFP